jgi:hypothetical protein
MWCIAGSMPGRAKTWKLKMCSKMRYEVTNTSFGAKLTFFCLPVLKACPQFFRYSLLVPHLSVEFKSLPPSPLSASPLKLPPHFPVHSYTSVILWTVSIISGISGITEAQLTNYNYIVIISCWMALQTMKRKYKQWWSTILPISAKQTITSHLKKV